MCKFEQLVEEHYQKRWSALLVECCNVIVIEGGGQTGAWGARLARPRWRRVLGWSLHPRRRVGGGWGDV